MSTPPQIKTNSQWVIDNFGPQSGLSEFGYNAPSVSYLDTFIDRQGESFLATEQSTDRIVSMLGAFIGEAIIATYGGEWQQGGKRSVRCCPEWWSSAQCSSVPQSP